MERGPVITDFLGEVRSCGKTLRRLGDYVTVSGSFCETRPESVYRLIPDKPKSWQAKREHDPQDCLDMAVRFRTSRNDS